MGKLDRLRNRVEPFPALLELSAMWSTSLHLTLPSVLA